MRSTLAAAVVGFTLVGCSDGGADSAVIDAGSPRPPPTFAPTTGPAPTFAPVPETTTTTTTTTTAGEGSAAPSTSAPGTPTPPSGDLQAQIASLPVAPAADSETYERDLFGGGWIDADGDGCDTRCEVLADERRTDLPGLPGGGWLSTFDGYSTDDRSELDIDHMVPLAEAWRSGASPWSGQQRLAYASDLQHPGSLIAVTAATNRSKSDRTRPSGSRPTETHGAATSPTGWPRSSPGR